MGQFAAFLGLALAFAACVYLYIVFPVQVVIACAKSPALSGTAKAIWLTACIIAAPIGTWIYCFATAQSLRWRATSLVSVVIALLAVSSVAQWLTHQSGDLRYSISSAAALVSSDQVAGDSAQKAQLARDLNQMLPEVQSGVMATVGNKTPAALMDLLHFYLRDHQLTMFEYQDWHERFLMRQHLDPADLELKIGILRGKKL